MWVLMSAIAAAYTNAVLRHGEIASPLRHAIKDIPVLKSIIGCTMCLAFYVGVAMYAMPDPISVLVEMMAVVGLGYLMAASLELISTTKKLMDKSIDHLELEMARMESDMIKELQEAELDESNQ